MIIILLLFFGRKSFPFCSIAWNGLLWMLFYTFDNYILCQISIKCSIPTVCISKRGDHIQDTYIPDRDIQRIHRINWWKMDKWSRFHIHNKFMFSHCVCVCVLVLFYYRWYIHDYTFAVSPVDTYTVKYTNNMTQACTRTRLDFTVSENN